MTCGEQEGNLAKPLAPSRQPYYDFFNDVRLEIGELEPLYPRLENFMEETRNYLENKDAQSLYRIAGLYFEKNKNREQGAWNYEDRFFVNGCQLHFIVYPMDQYGVFQNVVGIRKGYGRELPGSLVYYQIFTANPTDSLLETEIKTIVERNIDKHAPYIGAPLQ